MKAFPLISALVLLQPLGMVAQGTFRNMDFEQSQIPQNQPHGYVAADLAFPFWTVYYGASQQTQVLWNDVSVGSTQASLIGQFDPTAKPIAGGYSALLFGGPIACSLSQIGQVPTDAASMLFKAETLGPPPVVTIGGVSLPVFDVSSGPNYTLYGVDVSQFVGMQEDLRFIARPGYDLNLDDIVFSSTAVPEPTTGGLLLLGGLLVGSRKRSRKA
jgi:hypothetical protein